MADLTQYTDGLRELADVIDEASAREPTIAFREGVYLSLVVPPARVGYAARVLGDGEAWESLIVGAGGGFSRMVGPHQLSLFLSGPRPDPLVDPTFATSPVRVLHPAPGPRAA